MVRETCVQSQVASYQRLYLIPPYLTLSNIRYLPRVKWSNPGKGVVPLLHLGVVAIEKGAFWLPSTTVANFTFYFPKEMAKKTLFTFFQEINNDRSFHVTEYCQYDLLYWTLHKDLFLYSSISVFPLHELFFLVQVYHGKPIFSPFVKIF